jgi:hypothetical protein
MSSPAPFIWWIGRGVEITHLAPVVAAIINRRSDRFIRERWMRRLEIHILWDTIVAAIALGLAMARIRNLWFHDLTFFPGFALALWTLNGLRPENRLHKLRLAAMGAICLVGAYEAFRFGLSAKWVLTMSLGSAFLLFSSLWELVQLILENERIPLSALPSFWFLSVWVLYHGMILIFHPLTSFFLRTLSKEWVLYPWLVTYLLGGLFNVVLSKTFLCPKLRSS